MNLHTRTPALVVVEPRSLEVRRVLCYRASSEQDLQVRASRQVFDASGRLCAMMDARLERPATQTIHSLSGLPLLELSADAGWCLNFPSEAGPVRESRDSRGTQSWTEYDASLRPVSIAEQLSAELPRVVERFAYGDGDEAGARYNRCGQLVRRDDAAGSTAFQEYALTGVIVRQQRRFLAGLDSPDWPETLALREPLLEAEAHVSAFTLGPLGDELARCDARQNHQHTGYTCAGQRCVVRLQPTGSQALHTLVSEIRYTASGAVESETCGNGVVSRFFYDPQDGRLTRMLALSPAGQALQDLSYVYDPVGNVVSVEDATQAVSFFRNQRVEPVNRYVYDSLYQLIEATGREVVPASHLPELPDLHPLPLDPGMLINYTQRFEYDAGANLLARHHSGTETWRMAVSSMSNRSLPQRADGTLPDEGQIAGAFDGNGNLKALQPGQAMTWDARNQLSEVTAVKREDGPDDSELYRYDGDGQRVRKVRVSQARSRMLMVEVRYLPGLEVHSNEATGEVRHVLTIEAGRNSVRLLHWESGKPGGIENDQLRYSLSDHLGSSTLELDQDAKLISHEGYYPFGGTAWWTARSAVEANYKTVRYSGKERDATGLYYYGFRYYAPWLQRWVNPDPAGDVDGLNRYQMAVNNPIVFTDHNGLTRDRAGCVSLGTSPSKKQLVSASKNHFDNYIVPIVMARKEKDKERAVDVLIKDTQSVHANSVGELLEQSVGVLASANYTFNIPPDRINRLEGDFISNVWSRSQTQNTYTDWRDRLENQMFEYANSESPVVRMAAREGLDRSKRYLRPVYGALELTNDPVTVGGAPNYGRAAFYIAERSAGYMTMTATDSLELDLTIADLATQNNLYPLITGMRSGSRQLLDSLLTGGSAASVTEQSNYIEWQSHAPLHWKDMEMVKFQNAGDLAEIIKVPAAVRFFERHSLRATVKQFK